MKQIILFIINISQLYLTNITINELQDDKIAAGHFRQIKRNTEKEVFVGAYFFDFGTF